jgi:hypothetical protein
MREEGPTFNLLSWSLMCLTPLHFLQSLISMGLVYEDDRVVLLQGSTSEKILS